MSHPNSQHQGSLWLDTAREASCPADVAKGALRADVAIVGAGYTGLSSALHLAEQGLSVAVLEAEKIGSGASGLNGGQVIPGLKRDPDALERQFGDKGPGIIDVFGRGPDLVFSLIERHRINCNPSRRGWILAAHAPMAMASIKPRCEQWQARGADVALLSANEIAELTGSEIYAGGMIDRRAGTIQPLAYARGLARAAHKNGAQIFENSRVEALDKRDGAWRLGGRGFEISAKHVIIATDAYSGRLLPALEQSLLIVRSLQIATEPLTGREWADILGSGACLSETRKVAIYMRRDPDGRVLIGGRGPVGEGMPNALFESLQRRLVGIFPKLRSVPITHRWLGRVSLTLDELPHLHEPEPGLHIGCGYNGRGVAASTTMGKIIADRIAGGALADVLPATKLSGVPWRLVRQPLLTAGVHYYRLRDRLGFGA
ncbi:NAD(P)/FAD-dependent oxidoreductase [Rhodoligotrophos ferricapiens]|uniref:NAD(P)/FAD-dependent oxidoreductase n=1 Tax=Rhodoligotrophos ferricapiens TaxID=3069264 RepID=UPI00315CCD34